MMNDQLRQQIDTKLAELLVIANNRFNRSIQMPVVIWDCNDTRGGYHQNGILHFNPTLTIQNFDHYLATIVPHEMAHYIQKIVYPESLERKVVYRGYRAVWSNRKVHGREWQSIMRLFGIRNPERCHSYDVTDVRKRIHKRVPVYCGCPSQHIFVTMKIVNRMNTGRTYTCRTCKKRISLTNPLTPVTTPVSYSI